MLSIDGLKIANMNIHYFRYPFSFFLDQQDLMEFSSFVFWGSVPHIWVDQFGCEDVSQLKKMMRDHNAVLSAYAARPYNYSLFAPKGSLQRSCTKDYYRYCIDASKELEARRVCIDLWGALRDVNAERQYNNCAEMLIGLCEYSKQYGCSIAVGNVPGGNSALMNTIGELTRLKKDVSMDNCAIALDVCTALNNGESAKDWLDAFGTDLSMIYLADGRNTGSGYPLGFGCYPIEMILRSLKEYRYGGVIAIKMDREKNETDPVRTDNINISYLLRCSNGI